MKLTYSIVYGGLLGLALFGCDSGDAVQGNRPGEIEAHTTCELDGMLLNDYAGPKAQIFYKGQTAPVFFCDTVELFHTLLTPEQVKPVAAVFVQDMGKAEWAQPRGFWIEAKSAFYVFGSRRHGSMGPTVASFAHESEAKKFMQEWGGKLLRYADIRPDMVDLSGGALHDGRM